MKPYEEMWIHSVWNDKLTAGVETPGNMATFAGVKSDASGMIHASDDDIARAKLAAAAPDLVRVLLAVEWGDDQEDGDYCPSCGLEKEYYGGRHSEGCALDAALRKAGVR